MSDYEAGNWGHPGMPGAGAGGAVHFGSGLTVDGDRGGDQWSVSGGYLEVGPKGLHLAPGVAITGSWVIRGPGFPGVSEPLPPV